MIKPNFWIGCFQQPVESFAKWKAEGVNIVIQPASTNNNTAQQRRKAAADLGLFYIDVPDGADLVADALSMVADPACYAVCLPDEPTENMPWYTDPTSAAYVSSFLSKWKPAFDAVKGKKIIWCNVGSDRITSGRPWILGQMFLPVTTPCSVSEISFDCYPINAGTWAKWNAQTTNAFNGGNDPLLIPGETEQQFTYRVLQSQCPGLPMWAYLETTQINATPSPGGRSPTGAEVQFQADSLIKLGAKGLIYFSHSFGNAGGWSPSAAAGLSKWDGRSADVVAACKTLAAMNPSAVVTPPTPTPDLTALTNRVTALEASNTGLLAVMNAMQAVFNKIKAALS